MSEENQESMKILKRELEAECQTLKHRIGEIENVKTGRITQIDEKLQVLEREYQILINGIKEICAYLPQGEEEESNEVFKVKKKKKK